VVLGYGRDAPPPLLLLAARQLEPFDLELARDAYLTAYEAGTAYSEGARAGAPDAIQVADRWHISEDHRGQAVRGELGPHPAPTTSAIPIVASIKAVLGRDTGVLRFARVIDDAGTPTDPSDDTVTRIELLHAGQSMDFCALLEQAIG
jgi:hypothetical protein